ncbi:MAG: hypothetical protein Q9187_006919 [Circinaria calcarea]
MVRKLQVKPWHCPERGNFLNKIAFALAKNTKLREELTRLESLTKGLTHSSRVLLRVRQGAEIDKNPTQKEPQLLDKVKVMVDGFSEFANNLYSFQNQALGNHDWGLELRMPDPDGDATQTNCLASISVDFLIQCRCICNLWTAQRFRIEYRTQHSSQPNETPAQIGQMMLDQLRICTRSPQIPNQKQQFAILEAPVSQGPPTRKLLGVSTSHTARRKALEEERSVVALGLVNWMFLLWNTPWTSNPCTCKLRRTKLKSSRGQYILESCISSHTHPLCIAEDACEPKLLLLGRMLAELALGIPLGIGRAEDGQAIFFKDNGTLTQAELLQCLRRTVGNVGIVQAIQYCLDTVDLGVDVRVERLHEHAESALRPIQDDHLVIQKHIESQKGRRWRRNISKYLDESFDCQAHHYHSSMTRKVIPSPALTRPMQDIDLGEILQGSREDDGRPLQAVNDKPQGFGSEKRIQPESQKDEVQQLRLQLDKARKRNADLEAQLLLRPSHPRELDTGTRGD